MLEAEEEQVFRWALSGIRAKTPPAIKNLLFAMQMKATLVHTRIGIY